MLRIVLIAAAACAVLAVVLFFTRGADQPSITRGEPEKAPAAEEAALPAAAEAPVPAEPPVPAAPVVEPPVDQQVQDDAAAVGMTTREPTSEDEEPRAESAPPQQ